MDELNLSPHFNADERPTMKSTVMIVMIIDNIIPDIPRNAIDAPETIVNNVVADMLRIPILPTAESLKSNASKMTDVDV